MLKKLKRAARSFERKFESRGYRSPLRKDRPLTRKVSLVVPTYNVEPYIEEFLASVTSQSTGLRNLEVIIVDDGSTDRTGEIARAWSERYPRTINYIRQENQGAASARNTGLDHATGEWVSFPDPDDILDRKWLASFHDELLRKQPSGLMIVSMPFRVFQEQTGSITRSHPLNRLYIKRQVTRTKDLRDYILLSCAKAFFRRSDIEKHKLRFDVRVRPSFEDGHFISRLIAFSPNRSIVRLPKPGYIYRKRAAGTSQLDGVKSDPLWLTDQLRYGYLDLINQTRRDDGSVPAFVQRTVLYSLIWRFRHLMNRPERAAHITELQRAEFLALLREIFTFIDADIIRKMNLGGLTEQFKIALLAMFKSVDRGNDIVRIEQYDDNEEILQFSCYSATDSEPEVTIFVEGEPAQKLFDSRTASTFLDLPFFYEHRFWVHAPKSADLRATIQGRPARIREATITLGDRVSVRRAISSLQGAQSLVLKLPAEARRLRRYATSARSSSRFNKAWVFMDRDDAADDNAEHLYRYLMSIGQAKRAFFILRQDSPSWPRLKAEGFNLLPFGSDDHVAAVINADILASSHAANFVLWPVRQAWIKDLVKYKFVFLQHGVIHNDLSRALAKRPFRLFITSAPREYASIASRESNYLFTEREVKLTGAPRHDALLSRPQRHDTIFIMPTWRHYLSIPDTAKGAMPSRIDGFLESQFAQAWGDLLRSPRLNEIAQTFQKKIVFCPHPNISIYLDELKIPSYIECRDPLRGPSLQESFAEAALMVTDYSSVAFECAYINRPVCYYQFDKNDFFGGAHAARLGYFDFESDGFGPISETVDCILDTIQQTLEGMENPVYAERRENFFTFRDGRCCERVYNAIREILPEAHKIEAMEKQAAE